MWQMISIFGIAILFGIGVAICALPLLPVMVHKSKRLHEKFGEGFKEESYQRIYTNRKITSLGKILLIVGVFLTAIAIVLLLLLI